MKKLRLEPEELCVESFPTVQEQREAKGTVHGRASDAEPWSYPRLCWTFDQFESTCQPVYTCPECASPPESYYFACEPPIDA